MPGLIDLSGHRFGALTAIARAAASVETDGKPRWHCACDCGGTAVVLGDLLRRGVTRSCGCRRATANGDDLRGARFGALVVLDRAAATRDGKVYWRCRCDCGQTVAVRGTQLRAGRTRTCGAGSHRQGKGVIDLAGQRFGRLQVLGREARNDRGDNARWQCRCDCGGFTIVRGTHLRRGTIRSCGCLQRQQAAENIKSDGGAGRRSDAQRAAKPRFDPAAPRRDLTGSRFGTLRVSGPAGRHHGRKGELLWACVCDCGRQVTLRARFLRDGTATSCGCQAASVSPAFDLTGERFGRLVVERRAGSDRHGYARWACRCDCGGLTVVSSKLLRRGTTGSCGCLRDKGKQPQARPPTLASTR